MAAILPTDLGDASAPPDRKNQRQPMTNPPSRRVQASWADAAFALAARAAAILTLCLLLGIIGSLVVGAWPAIHEYGLGFFTSTASSLA